MRMYSFVRPLNKIMLLLHASLFKSRIWSHHEVTYRMKWWLLLKKKWSLVLLKLSVKQRNGVSYYYLLIKNKGDIISRTRTVLAMQVKKYIGTPISQKEPKQWHFPMLASPASPLSHVPCTWSLPVAKTNAVCVCQ